MLESDATACTGKGDADGKRSRSTGSEDANEEIAAERDGAEARACCTDAAEDDAGGGVEVAAFSACVDADADADEDEDEDEACVRQDMKPTGSDSFMPTPAW